MHVRRIALAAGTCVVAGQGPAQAQIDYRNLDDHRPVRTEDAYPVERYAFDLLLSYEYQNSAGDRAAHVFSPELGYGVLANTQIGVRLPLAVLDTGEGSDWGFAGPRLFGLYNFNTESPGLPALSIRADLSLPVGHLSGSATQLTLKGIATRGWGLARLHVNGTVRLGRTAGVSSVGGEPRWSLSVAGDRTFIRQSLLVIGELGVLDPSGEPGSVLVSLGLRYQLTPSLVLDGGLSRQIASDTGPNTGLTVGLSHVFAIAAPLPVD